MAEVIRERVVDRPVERVYDNPSSTNSGFGFLLAVILLVVVLFLLFFYGLPLLKTAASPRNNIQIPDKIDVNINSQPNGGQ